MSPFLFWLFASLTLIFGAAVVLNPNPVASALSLVASFLGLSALFMSLDEERRRINWLTAAGGFGVAVILLVQICVVIVHFQAAKQTFPPLARPTSADVWNIGQLLFMNYNLPFQVIGVLVLVATIGVVLLSRREPR
jgi:NADH-quinone oxidoreductase subunit J